ncbi:MAG: histidine phosphatase family protein [Dehalococcoidia bacterium]|nr:histidine phosphatase family protein [Dehalococcoidia bacterium]MCB9484787.1 histidine phosphatase family protein [Thermoflexaceae bacterium]
MAETRRIRTMDLENPFAESFEGMCELLLIRHGEQQFRENIPLGEAVDAPLSEMGWMQARAVGNRLAAARLDKVYASPLQRALNTGKEIAGHHGLEVKVVDDLSEIDLWKRAPQDKGLLDIYSRDELIAVFREVSATRKNSAYPYCEDPDAFRTRIVAAIDRIVADSIGHRVAVVCHGGVINSYLSHLMQSAYDHLVAVHHTSITVVRAADTRRELLTINDYSHVMPFQTARGGLNASR